MVPSKSARQSRAFEVTLAWVMTWWSLPETPCDHICVIRYCRVNITLPFVFACAYLPCRIRTGRLHHDDETPSLDVWRDEPGGSIQRPIVDDCGVRGRNVRSHARRCRMAQASDSRSICGVAAGRDGASLH